MVSSSELMLRYWIRSDRLSRWRKITIDISQDVSTLIDSINPDVTLYKVKTTIPNDESGDNLLGGLSLSELGNPLRSSSKISCYFDSRTPVDILHFVVGLWHL